MSLSTEEKKRWEMYQKLLKISPEKVKAIESKEEEKWRLIHKKNKARLNTKYRKKHYIVLNTELNKYGLQKRILAKDITKEQEEKEEDFYNNYLN